MSGSTSNPKNGGKLGFNIRDDVMQKLLAVGLIIVLSIIFIIGSKYFLTFPNVYEILKSVSITGVLALGSTFVLTNADIDLSIGPSMIFSSIIASMLILPMHLPLGFTIIAMFIVSIIVSAAIGAINGLMVSVMGLPAFIATLGMQFILKGLNLVVTGAVPIYNTSVKGFDQLANGSVIAMLFKTLGASEKVVGSLSIPNAFLIFMFAALIASTILTRTKLGRYTFAMGSNLEATRLSGINTIKWKTIVFALNGAFVGVAGVLMASKVAAAMPAEGAGYEMEAFAATVIGGTSMSGGEGSILGSIIGALLMQILTNGLRLLQYPQQIQWIVTGLMVIATVFIDNIRRKHAGRA